jgi:AcrR family transcriptional regulator
VAAPAETLVERRRRLLRDEIRTIAVELFIARGFDAVTVDEIAEACGTSQRTFFRYFASKDDIMLGLDDRLLAAVAARPVDEGPVAALREAFRSTSRVAPGERARVLALASILAHAPELRARAHGERLADNDRLVAELGRRSRRSSDRKLHVAVTAMTAVADAEFHAWAAAGGRGDPSERIAAALGLLGTGLAALDG